MHGNPFLRLIRSEVEAFVEKKYGGLHLTQQKIQAELTQIDKDLRCLEKQAAQLRERKAALLATLDEEVRRHSHRTAKTRRARR